MTDRYNAPPNTGAIMDKPDATATTRSLLTLLAATYKRRAKSSRDLAQSFAKKGEKRGAVRRQQNTSMIFEALACDLEAILAEEIPEDRDPALHPLDPGPNCRCVLEVIELKQSIAGKWRQVYANVWQRRVFDNVALEVVVAPSTHGGWEARLPTGTVKYEELSEAFLVTDRWLRGAGAVLPETVSIDCAGMLVCQTGLDRLVWHRSAVRVGGEVVEPTAKTLLEALDILDAASPPVDTAIARQQLKERGEVESGNGESAESRLAHSRMNSRLSREGISPESLPDPVLTTLLSRELLVIARDGALKAEAEAEGYVFLEPDQERLPAVQKDDWCFEAGTLSDLLNAIGLRERVTVPAQPLLDAGAVPEPSTGTNPGGSASVEESLFRDVQEVDAVAAKVTQERAGISSYQSRGWAFLITNGMWSARLGPQLMEDTELKNVLADIDAYELARAVLDEQAKSKPLYGVVFDGVWRERDAGIVMTGDSHYHAELEVGLSTEHDDIVCEVGDPKGLSLFTGRAVSVGVAKAKAISKAIELGATVVGQSTILQDILGMEQTNE